jgi:hypothetical protein
VISLRYKLLPLFEFMVLSLNEAEKFLEDFHRKKVEFFNRIGIKVDSEGFADLSSPSASFVKT